MIYEYWLAGIKEITDLKKQKLREVYGSGKAIYYIEETKLDKLRFLNEKDVAILKNAKKDTELEEKWRRRLLGRETVRRMVNRWHYNMEKALQKQEYR